MVGKCELCGRENELNEHHLIPKSNHKNKWFKKNFTLEDMKNCKIWVCKDSCHPTIHKFISEKDLGRYYNTLELLKEHTEIKKFIQWVSKQTGKIKKTLK
jgi:hypothetical protein